MSPLPTPLRSGVHSACLLNAELFPDGEVVLAGTEIPGCVCERGRGGVCERGWGWGGVGGGGEARGGDIMLQHRHHQNGFHINLIKTGSDESRVMFTLTDCEGQSHKSV